MVTLGIWSFYFMPEENIHLDDYGDGTKPENSRGKFFAVFIVIIFIVVGVFIILRLIANG